MSLPGFGAGFMVGFGTGFFSREVIPFVSEIVRPVSKVIFKSGIKIFEKTREEISRFGESIEDSFAEAREEMKKDKVKKRRSPTKSKPTVVTAVERTG